MSNETNLEPERDVLETSLRRGKNDQAFLLRISQETRNRLEAVCSKYEASRSHVLRIALELLFKQAGV